MRRIRVLISIILLVIFSIVFLSIAADYKYVGSVKSNKYHYLNCEWTSKINPANLVKFASAREAQDAGYVPCKVCRPPVKD